MTIDPEVHEELAFFHDEGRSHVVRIANQDQLPDSPCEFNQRNFAKMKRQKPRNSVGAELKF